MTDKEMEALVRPNPEAYKRFKRAKRKRFVIKIFLKLKSIWNVVSKIILWVCAVGGFILALYDHFS